jgi:acyl carrier protein
MRAAERVEHMATIEERLKKVLQSVVAVDDEQFTPNASFVDDFNADSFDLVEIVMGLEEEFNIDIKPEEMEQITTVKDALAYLEKRLR